MSTRCGDIDPLLTVYLMATHGYRIDEMLEVLNKRSGLLGVSELSSDITDIILRVRDEDDAADLALRMYVHRLVKYVGSYVAALGGVDVLAFTDDIGVGNPLVRQKVCESLGFTGLILDERLNARAPLAQVAALHAADSTASVLTIPADEELVIFLAGAHLIRARGASSAVV